MHRPRPNRNPIPGVYIVDESECVEGCPCSCVLPVDLADPVNLQQQLDRVVRQLRPILAAVLLAHKRDGLSYEQVAVKLGLSVFPPRDRERHVPFACGRV